MLAPLEVQAAPVAAAPFEQEQEFATHDVPLKHTKNNVKPYSHALQSIMTAARMGGADRHTIATGLGIGFDARYTRYEKVDERATKNLSTVENSLENTENKQLFLLFRHHKQIDIQYTCYHFCNIH